MKRLMRQTASPLGRLGSRLALVPEVVLIALLSPGSAQQIDRKPETTKSASSVDGQAVFKLRCAACHGLDGRGGEHAPDIVANPSVRAMSEPALVRVVENGVPRAGMPGFKMWMTPDETQAVVRFIRDAGGRVGVSKALGDPAQGKALYFGKAGCGDCHMISGRGGFLGADLSGFGRHHSALEIKQAILHPDNPTLPGKPSVTLTTKDGRQWSGVVRNEDNFSVQVLDAQGVFHLFMKSDLASVKRERSPMPDDYGSRLTPREVDNLVSYLANAGRPE
jgi:cytochrome c oxidase cbb3-type subunit 3